MRNAAVLALMLMLIGCQRAEEQASLDMAVTPGSAPAAEPAAPAGEATAEAAPDADPSARVSPGPPAPAAGLPMLAYAYRYEIEARAEAARGLMRRHEQACQQAGPLTCQVLAAQVRQSGEDQIHATLSMRATPAWVARFRAGLEQEARQAGGRVTGARTETEDLSRQIVDTEARLRALTALRDRLQALLAGRPGKLQELLEVERELARVQGELDAIQSTLAVMRARVATSALEITYASSGVLAPEGVFTPLAEALRSVLRLLVMSLAVIVQVLAVALPWLLLAALLWWLLRKRVRPFWRRRPPPAD